MLIRPGELVEQGCLSAVLVADQRKCQHVVFRERLRLILHMMDARLSDERMGNLLSPLLRNNLLWLLHPGHFDLPGVIQTQCQFIPVDPQLHRVSQRRELDQCNLRAGYHPHVQKMLSEGTLSADRFDPGALPCL